MAEIKEQIAAIRRARWVNREYILSPGMAVLLLALLRHVVKLDVSIAIVVCIAVAVAPSRKVDIPGGVVLALRIKYWNRCEFKAIRSRNGRILTGRILLSARAIAAETLKNN